jgi:hypothetical protein
MHQQPSAAILAEQVLERRPQIGSEWADRELHAAFALIMFASRSHQNMAGAFLAPSKRVLAS